MRFLARIALPVVSILAVCGCAAGQSDGQGPQTSETAVQDDTITILVAIDGVRPDYLDRGLTPNLSRLAESGVRGSMQPSFPSVTMPNYYTFMTGKVPDRHGIVGNEFQRADGVPFGQDIWNPKWWGEAVPLWVSVEAQGRGTAHLFYPATGTDAAGNPPRNSMLFTKDIAPADEPAKLLEWMDGPGPVQPRFLTLYFYPVDNAGHEHGPNSPELNDALKEVDTAIGNLLTELQRRGLSKRTNLVIVSDHGMAETLPGQLELIDEWAQPETIRPITLGTYAAIAPAQGITVEAIAAKLVGRHSHSQCWRKEDLPARFHFGSNPRIAPIVCLADKGWLLTTAQEVRQYPDRYATVRGNHGYDPADSDMTSIFIANGPAFRRGVTLPKFENANLYFLLARLTGTTPEPGDGSIEPFKRMLK